MTPLRSVRTIVAIFAVSVAATACGDGSGGLPEPDFLLRGATAASGDVTSAHVEMTTSGQVPGLPARTLSADVLARKGSQPGSSVGTADVSGIHVQFVERDGELYSKSADGKYVPAQQLSAAAAGLPKPSAMLDPERGLAKMLAHLSNPRTEVREHFDGVQAFRVTGAVPGEYARVWLPSINEDARLTVWFATAGRHLPVGTRLTVTDSSGKPVTIDFALSDLNKKVQVPTIA
ncbi:LppX_LprAFG lipoprotein [Nocardia gipuzkoensis]|uniref:LppX_LprAFG lipoprotein n=1 Tax=Nocardia gipuzkoensis TaxID=2749991 RepID=UPI003EE03BF5